MDSNISKKKKILAFSVIVIIASGIIGYILYLQANDVMYQTNIIMEKVPLHCYLFYPELKYKEASSVELTYYNDVKTALNNTGMKYVFPFMRSAAFHGYLIQHCPFLNQTKSTTPPKNFESDLAVPNITNSLSSSWLDSIKLEQDVHNYNLGPRLINNTNNQLWNLYADYYNDNVINSKHFKKFEDGAFAFNMSLPEFNDQFFLPWNNVLDVNNYQYIAQPGMFHQPSFVGCKNPSWRANSDIQQCNWWSSHWVINVHTQELIGILDTPPIQNKT